MTSCHMIYDWLRHMPRPHAYHAHRVKYRPCAYLGYFRDMGTLMAYQELSEGRAVEHTLGKLFECQCVITEK